MRILLVNTMGEPVTQGELMPHIIPFEALWLGTRIFVYQQALTDQQPDDGPLVYREGTAISLAEGVTWQEDPR